MTNKLPHSREAEQSLLGALLLDYTCFDRIAMMHISPDDFYDARHSDIYRTIQPIFEQKEKVDVVIADDALAAANLSQGTGGMSYLIEISKNAPGTANVDAYARIVKERSILRHLLSKIKAIDLAIRKNSNQKSAEEIMKLCIESINNLKDSNLIPAKQAETILESKNSFIEYLHSRMVCKNDLRGIESGLKDLDYLTDGFCGSQMYVIAARPSVGKSSLGLFFASMAAMNGYKALFWSTEMSNNTILARLYSNILLIPARNLTHDPKNLTEKQLENILEMEDDFKNIFIENSYPHVKQICDKAREMKKKGQIDILIVDYLQNLKGDGDNTVERLGYISNELKKLSMEIDIPVIALAQLNRTAQHMDVPSMAEIKGSSVIEQDADFVMLLHHNDQELHDKYWLLCQKNRHGETGNIPIIFDKKFQNFMIDGTQNRILNKKKRGITL